MSLKIFSSAKKEVKDESSKKNIVSNCGVSSELRSDYDNTLNKLIYIMMLKK